MRSAFTLLLLLTGSALLANNITVSNTSLTGQNTTSHYTNVNFDVAWENSWRTSTNESNYDGAWIFIKFRKNSTTDWRHCTISSTGNTAASGATFFIPSDNKGAFIYRSADGIGNVSWAANQLRWNYGVDGVLDNETVEVRVFALEMVYIPQGSFQLGSGGTETNAFKDGPSASPYLVASNNAIPFGNTAGTLNPNGLGPTSGTLPAAFPKGFNAFWIAKYECSQQQYVDFLNHIDNARAAVNNTPAIFTGTHPNLIAPQPERALTSVSTARLAAHADWAALRPMTELEFEKASRGYNTPAVPNEYVWGNTTLVNITGVTNSGLATEAVASPATANANTSSSLNQMVRVGIFARPSGSDRTLSGATYYGVMNMGDNVNEICFTVVNAPGQAIDASIHGDGYLAASGNTDIPTWTSYNAYGLRGAAYNGGVIDARTSERRNANFYLNTYGSDAVVGGPGIRLVRTAQ